MKDVLKFAVRMGADLTIEAPTWYQWSILVRGDISTPLLLLADKPDLVAELKRIMRGLIEDFFYDVMYAEGFSLDLHRIANYPDMLKEIISFI